MNPVSLTTPPILGAEIVSCMALRCSSEMRLPESSANEAATVMTPSPPIWKSAKMTPWPNAEKYTAVSWTTSPVTHTADVEVKRASMNGVTEPSRDDTGSISSAAPVSMTSAKPRMMIWNTLRRLRVPVCSKIIGSGLIFRA